MSVIPTYDMHFRTGKYDPEDFVGTDANVWAVLPQRYYTLNVTGTVCSERSIAPGAGSMKWWIVTTPNMGIIPKTILGPRVVRARADGRYELNDRTLHPQYYSMGFQWMGCIPRRPDPHHELAILWLTPQLTDTVIVPNPGFNIILRRLRPDLLDKLAALRDGYIKRCRTYEEKKDRQELMGLLETGMCQCISVMKHTAMEYRDIVRYFAEVAKNILDLHGLLDYLTIFYPRLFPTTVDRVWLSGINKLELCDRSRMGAFTEDPTVANQLFAMGLPVWLLRPCEKFSREVTNIYHGTRETETPNIVYDDYGDLRDQTDGPAYPTIYKGNPGLEMNQKLQRIGCRFQDLIEVTAVAGDGPDEGPRETPRPVPFTIDPNPPTAHPQPTDATATAPGPVKRRNAGRSKVRAPVQSRPAAATTKGPQEIPIERFLDTGDDPRAPPSIELWARALENVNRAKSMLVHHGHGTIGFRFPDPHLFLAGRNGFIHTACWLITRIFHMGNIVHGVYETPTTAQQWRDGLNRIRRVLGPDFDTLATSMPTPALPAQVASSSSHVAHTVSRKRKRNDTLIFPESYSLDSRSTTTIDFHDFRINLSSPDLLQETLPLDLRSLVLWELHENNFRFELLTLDKIMAPTKWQAAPDRDEGYRQPALRDAQVLKVFPAEDGGVASYVVGAMPKKNVGLAAECWRERAPYVTALGMLLRDWQNCPSDIIEGCSRPLGETSFRDFENKVAGFYCQTFSNHFSRAPVLPRRLPSFQVDPAFARCTCVSHGAEPSASSSNV
ncbi:hypothetical protein FPV67DRAFT_1673056 [Lyophyllum atratum]|nr:hypothetical protein FPV67DRAFT_1673056 [Lyophyllum atratum]